MIVYKGFMSLGLVALRQLTPGDVLNRKLTGGGPSEQMLDAVQAAPTASAALQAVHRYGVSMIDTQTRTFLHTPWAYVKEDSDQQATFGGTSSFQITSDAATYISECFLRIQIGRAEPVDSTAKIRYVAFPAHRLAQRVAIKHQRAALEQLSPEIFNAYYELFVPKDRKAIWREFVGQDHELQTFQSSQPAVEWILPLQFFFCGQQKALNITRTQNRRLKIELDLAPASEIFSLTGGGGGASTPSTQFVEPTIRVELWYKAHYVVPELIPGLSKPGYERAVRIWQHQKTTVTNLTDGDLRITLKDVTYPIETLLLGIRPVINQQYSQHWGQNAFLEVYDTHDLVIDVTETRSQFDIVSVAGREVRVKRVDGYDPALAIKPDETYNLTWDLYLTYQLSAETYSVAFLVEDSKYSVTTDEFTLILRQEVPTAASIIKQELRHYGVISKINSRVWPHSLVEEFQGVTFAGTPVFPQTPVPLLRDVARLNGAVNWLVVPFSEVTGLYQSTGYLDIRGKAREFSINLKVNMSLLEKMKLRSGTTDLEVLVIAQTFNILYQDDVDGLYKLRFI